jgi:hypothetical protein
MSTDTVSRASLAIVGRALGLQQSVLSQTAEATDNHVAETFEAILGAIYVDSNYSVKDIRDVVKTVRLDDHKFLKTREQEFKMNEDEVPKVTDSSRSSDNLSSPLIHRRESAVRDPIKSSASSGRARNRRSQARLDRDTPFTINYIPQQDPNPTLSEDMQAGRPDKKNGGANKKRPGPKARALDTKTKKLSPWVKSEMKTLVNKRNTTTDPERAEAVTKAIAKFYKLLREGVEESPMYIYRDTRSAVARMYETKMAAEKSELMKQGLPYLKAQHTAWQKVRSATHAPAEQQTSNTKAIAEQAIQNEAKEEGRTVEPRASMPSTRLSKRKSGAQSKEGISPSPSLMLDMQKDRISDVEHDRKALRNSLVHGQSPNT